MIHLDPKDYVITMCGININNCILENSNISIQSKEEKQMEQLIEQHLQDKYNDDLEDLCTSDAVTIACEDFPELIQQILQATSLDAATDIVEALREGVYSKFKELHKDEVEQGLYDNLRGDY